MTLTGLAAIAFVVLLILKLTGLAVLTWGQVFIPVFIALALLVIQFIIAAIIEEYY